MENNKTVPVPSEKITLQDAIKMVKSLQKTASDAERDYLFKDIMAQRQTQPTVQVPVQFARDRGWTPGVTTGMVLGVMGVGALIYFLTRPKRA